MEEWSVASPAAVCDALRTATRGNHRVIARGLATRPIVGPFAPGSEPTVALRTTGLSMIEQLDRDELVLTAQAGTPLAEISEALLSQGLFLPPLFLCNDLGTLGGLFSDPRESPMTGRLGAIRDHVLGVEAVRGDGVPFRAGGRVVKNVTGYDLTRFLCGARGRWAVITRLHWRLQPRPAMARRCRYVAPSADVLWDGLDRLRRSSCDPLALSLVAGAASPSGVSETLVDILEAGTETACDARLARARACLSGMSEPESSMALDIASALPEFAAPTVASTSAASDAMLVRVHLPYSAWRTVWPHGPAGIDWVIAHPFAQWGRARLRTEGQPIALAASRLRHAVARVGGTVTFEAIAPDLPHDANPWGREADDEPGARVPLARIRAALGESWDRAGVLGAGVPGGRA